MNLDDDDKTTVLISALEERYESIHLIRGRVEQFCLWALGILFGAAGWIIYTDTPISDLERVVFFVGACIAFYVLRFVYLEDLVKGFRGQFRAAVRIETILKLYTPGFFDDTENSVYDKKWSETGTQNGDGKFFESSFALLYVGFAALLISLAISGHVETCRMVLF